MDIRFRFFVFLNGLKKKGSLKGLRVFSLRVFEENLFPVCFTGHIGFIGS